MKTDLLLVSLTMLVLTAAGCQHDAPKDSGASAAKVELQNVEWRLATLDGKPIVKPSENDKPISLLFEAERKRASGYAGVNQFSGTYLLDGQKLKFSPLAMTRRAGAPDLMQQESEFGQALEKTVSWRAAAGGIELRDAMDSVLATFTVSP